MKIKFIGATGGDVTGSCILCCARNGVRFLVDCGSYQGGRFLETKNARFPFDPKSIDFVLLTHAHFDHCGRLPMLYDCGFKGKVICNNETRDLTILNIMDGYRQERWKRHHAEKWKQFHKIFHGAKNKTLSEEERNKREKSQWDALSQEEKQEIWRRDADWRRECEQQFRQQWEDSLQEGWGERFKNYWKERFLTEDSIQKMMEDRNIFRIDSNLSITMLRSSHFLGAVSFVVGWNSDRDSKAGKEGLELTRNICFTGDLGVVSDDEENCLTLLKTGMVPFLNTDYIVMESTYGDTTRDPEHKNFDKRIECLKSFLENDEVDDFVFACFSMQRTQDVLFDLIYLAMKEKIKLNINLDSSMGIEACGIYSRTLKKIRVKNGEEKFVILNKEFVERFFPLLEETGYSDCMAQETEMGIKIHAVRKFIGEVLRGAFSCANVSVLFKSEGTELEDAKNICITSSGMFEYGKISKHILWKHHNERAAFVITGFCKPTNNGRVLSAWAEGEGTGRRDEAVVIETGDKEKRIDRKAWKAKLYSVAPYYSGHADADGLLRFLFHSSHSDKIGKEEKKEVTAFLVHGEANSRTRLKEKIEAESQKPENQNVRMIKGVELPNATSPFYDLDADKWLSEDTHQQLFTYSLSEEQPEQPKKKKKKKKEEKGEE